MTFQFSDFENESTGTVPSGWSVGEKSSGDRVDVTDYVAIQGDKSFLIRDSTGGWAEAYHSVGDESIEFAVDFNQDAQIRYSRQIEWFAENSDGTVLWSYLFTDDGSGDTFEIYYDTATQDIQGPGTGTNVGSVAIGPHEIRIDEPQNGISLIIDGETVHSSTDSFLGASELWLRSDDISAYYDGAVSYSDFVYHENDAVGLGAASHDYVIEGGEDSDSALVSDRGDSDFVSISGRGVGHE